MNGTTPLPEKDLPPGRHQQLKEHLMSEIRQTQAQDQDQTQAPAQGTSPERVGSPSRRKKWLRPAVAGPAVAGALTLAVLAGVALNGSDGSDGSVGSRTAVGRDERATYAFAPHVNADTTGGAAELLGRVATVAAESRVGEGIRDDQFVYTRSKVAFAATTVGVGTELEPLHAQEVWRSVDGTRRGLLRERDADNRDKERPLDADPAPGKPGYESSNNYRHLQTLPTDPDAMLRWLRSQANESEERDSDQDAFVLIGNLLNESLMPPAVGAALYRAAAKIPDVRVLPDAVNAAGRHGVAIARYDSYNEGVRDELIFDKETLEYMGTRSVATKATDDVKAGQVLGTTAVLDTAVVDRAGLRP